MHLRGSKVHAKCVTSSSTVSTALKKRKSIPLHISKYLQKRIRTTRKRGEKKCPPAEIFRMKKKLKKKDVFHELKKFCIECWGEFSQNIKNKVKSWTFWEKRVFCFLLSSLLSTIWVHPPSIRCTCSFSLELLHLYLQNFSHLQNFKIKTFFFFSCGPRSRS